ncbi:hypothetical protein GCM10023188_27320 [Pontibacter saemangeumensis]|uniref:DUF5723 domain-containing protein n=2 Tax=Pontibacter saemangeumensis TaxID=1084525 RepID=A0ABP8LTP4_9BACT
MQAQHLLGSSGSNYAGTNAIFLNPSSIADAKQGFYLNLFGGHVTFANTYFHYDGAGVETDLILEDPEGIWEGDGLFERSRIRERLDGKPKMAHFGVDLRLPSFMLKLNPRHSIGFTTRFRTALQATNVSEDIAQVIGLGTDNPALQNTPFTGSEFYFNTNAFAETGFTYAMVLLSQEKRFLKGGFTVKRLTGIYSAHLLAPDVDYQMSQNQQGESYMQVQQGSANFGFSRSEFDIDEEEVGNAFFGGNAPGSGWGVDIGFTYEHRPNYTDYQYTLDDGKERTDHGENKYRYRVGVALLDVGSITYKDPQQVRAYDIERQNLDLSSETFEGVDLENIVPTLEEALKVQASERKTDFTSGLPTALHLNFDYRITRNLFLNTAVLHSLRNKESVTMHQPSALAVAPRLEGKRLELALPVYLTNNYRDLNFGAMLRLGSFVVGSNNLAAMLPGSKAVGPDLYMGLGISIGTGGQRAKAEEKARKKEAKEQRKVEKGQKKADKATMAPQPSPAPPSQTPANTLQSTSVDTTHMAPIDSLVIDPVDTLHTAPVDTLKYAPVDSVGTTPADSLSGAAREPVQAVATDSSQTPVVEPLQAQPTTTPAAIPATIQPTSTAKPEGGAGPKPENKQQTAPAIPPAGATETKAPPAISND